MPDQPSRVSPGEISDLLAQARDLKSDSPLGEQISYFRAKASILSRIAAELDTPEAHRCASAAWHYVGDLCRKADKAEGAG